MTSIHDVVDFFIFPFEFVSVKQKNWVVCTKPTSGYLGVHGDLDSAIAHARQMGEYRSSAGQPVQIHLRQGEGEPWKTIWHSAEAMPRYP